MGLLNLFAKPKPPTVDPQLLKQLKSRNLLQYDISGNVILGAEVVRKNISTQKETKPSYSLDTKKNNVNQIISQTYKEFPFSQESKQNISKAKIKFTQEVDTNSRLFNKQGEQGKTSPRGADFNNFIVKHVFPISPKMGNIILEKTKFLQKLDKANIDIHTEDPIVLAHEMLHQVFEYSPMGEKNEDGSVNKNAANFGVRFLDTWDKLAQTDQDAPMQMIDAHIGRDYDISEMAGSELATERFSYLGEMVSKYGVDVIPKELRPFYRGVFDTSKKDRDSQFKAPSLSGDKPLTQFPLKKQPVETSGTPFSQLSLSQKGKAIARGGKEFKTSVVGGGTSNFMTFLGGGLKFLGATAEQSPFAIKNIEKSMPPEIRDLSELKTKKIQSPFDVFKKTDGTYKETTVKKATDFIGDKLLTQAKTRLEEHPEWSSDITFSKKPGLEGVKQNLRNHPVEYVSTLVGSQAPTLLSQVTLALTTSGAASLAFMGIGAGGETYLEAKEFGDSEEEAINKGLFRGTIEGYLENVGLSKIFPNINKGKIADDFLDNLFKQVKGKPKAILSEITTEELQNFNANAIAKTYDENRDIFDTKEFLETALISGFSTAGLTSFQSLVGKPVPGLSIEDVSQAPYKETGEVTTKILKDLEGKTTVSREYVSNLTNQGSIKQAEREVIRETLDEMEGDHFSATEFADKVKTKLLPLSIKTSDNLASEGSYGTPRYENVNLPTELRGDVKNYIEHIYESPIKTSAGNVHFSEDTDNYFAHVRIEEMSDGELLRVLELQSDLMQKGRLEKEDFGGQSFVIGENKYQILEIIPGKDPQITILKPNGEQDITFLSRLKPEIRDQIGNPTRLQPYRNTWHERIIREEIKRASLEGKTRLQFPTGETAMKIEGLGQSTGGWTFTGRNGVAKDLEVSDLEVGKQVTGLAGRDEWIITEVLEDGKFRAVEKRMMTNDIDIYQSLKDWGYYDDGTDNFTDYMEKIGRDDPMMDVLRKSSLNETFDISGKVDTENPIYKFYEKTVQKYLNKFGGKKVTDDKGVTWIEVPVTEDMGGAVEAFKKKSLTDARSVITEQSYGVQRLQEYKDRLKLNFDVQLFNTIFTGEIKDGKPVEAWGVTYENNIALAETVSKWAADHEVAHYAFKNLKNIPLFMGISRAKIEAELRAKYGENVDIEEKLAEDFEVYKENELNKQRQTATGETKNFFEKLWENIKEFFRGNPSEIEVFYKKISEGVSKRQQTGITKGKSRYTIRGNDIYFEPSGETSFVEKASPQSPLHAEARKAQAEGQTFEEFVKGQGEPLYHGTNRLFDKFDIGEARKLRAEKFGTPEAVFLSKEKNVARKYAEAEQNKLYPKARTIEVVKKRDPLLGQIVELLVEKGQEGVPDSLWTKTVAAEKVNGIDYNLAYDIAESIEGTKAFDTPSGFSLPTMFGGIDPQVMRANTLANSLEEIGIDPSTILSKRTVETFVDPSAKIKDVGYISERYNPKDDTITAVAELFNEEIKIKDKTVEEALAILSKQAKENGFDGIRFQTEQSIDNTPEVGIWNTEKIKTKSQLEQIWKEANAETAQFKKKAPTTLQAEELATLKAKKKQMLDDYMAGEGGLKAQIVVEDNNMLQAHNMNSSIVEGIKNNAFYRKEGGLKDSMGEGFLMRKAVKSRNKDPKKVSTRFLVAEKEDLQRQLEMGYEIITEIDSFANEAGFDRGEDYLQEMLNLSELPTDLSKVVDEQLLETDKEYADISYKLETAKQEMRGEKVTMEKYMTELGKRTRTKHRRQKISAIKTFFGLTDRELKQVSRKDPAFMREGEFEEFLQDLEARAFQYSEVLQKRNELIGLIQERQLQKTENMRQAMKLPVIDKMSTEQLTEYIDVLSQYQLGDVFLPVRRMEVLQKTKLKDAKVWREVSEKMSEFSGKPLTELQNVVAKEFDRFRADSLLAQQNPVYELAVEEMYTAFAGAEITKLKLKQEVDALATLSRRSGNRTLADRFVPTDDKVVEWLESDNKEELAKDMTQEEIEFATYLQTRWRTMYDYLIKMESMYGGIDNYFAHIRRGFAETVKEDGLLSAFREMSKQAELDKLAFGITDAKTGQILAFEKFFGNAQRRTGALVPTKNAAKSFTTYVNAFETKKALDQVTPVIDTYIQASAPTDMTRGGLLLHGDMQKFFKEWLNNKRGRKFDFGGVLKQGGKLDRSIRLLRAVTTVKDLGFSLPTGLASIVGEQIVTYKKMGEKKFALGKVRRATSKGRAILKKYDSFVGESLFSELRDASKTFGDKTMTAMFGLFHASSRIANKDFLLGSLTKEEYDSGTISDKRLAQLKLRMGMFRQISGMESVTGATSAGSAAFQYKGWAVRILADTINNYKKMAQDIRRGKFKNLATSSAFHEELRGALTTTAGVLLIGLLASKYEDDDTLLGQLIKKAHREITTLYGAISPKMMLSTPRVLTFLADVGEAVQQLVTLEKYASGVLKSKKSVTDLLMPTAVKQFKPTEDTPEQQKKKAYKDLQKQLKNGIITKEVASSKMALEIKKINEKTADDFESSMSKLSNDEAHAELKKMIDEKVVTKAEAEKIMKKKIKDEKEKTEEREKVAEAKEKGVLMKSEEETILDIVQRGAKALRVDPWIALKAIFSDENIDLVSDQRVGLERVGMEVTEAFESEFVDKKNKKNYNVEHWVPRSIGGKNTVESGNLRIIPKALHDEFSPVENMLVDAVEANSISPWKARSIVKKYKDIRFSEFEEDGVTKETPTMEELLSL